MSNNRMIAILAVVALLGTTAFVIGTGLARSIPVGYPTGASANLLRQASRDIPVTGAEAPDYFERHPEVLELGSALDLSDYYQRHPVSTAAAAAGASDWFLRHPGALRPENKLDLSDYYLRHPTGVSAGAGTEAMDYFQRHPDSLRPGTPEDQSDWFQRHAD